jgi:hypothetical protein
MEKDYDNIVQMVQDGKMTINNFLMQSEDREDYINWLEERKLANSEENADKYLEYLDGEIMDGQKEPNVGN